VIDVDALHREILRPVVTVTRKKPDLAAMERALQRRFDDWEPRLGSSDGTMWRRSARSTELYGSPTWGGPQQSFRKRSASRPSEGCPGAAPRGPSHCGGHHARESRGRPDGRGRTRSMDRETQERGNPTERLEFLSAS